MAIYHNDIDTPQQCSDAWIHCGFLADGGFIARWLRWHCRAVA
jgi:hypothetical protein